MNDLAPEQQTPGEHGIQVQRIIIAGEFGEGKLIVRCKYTLCHRSLVSCELYFQMLLDTCLRRYDEISGFLRDRQSSIFNPDSYGLSYSNKLNMLGHRKRLLFRPGQNSPPAAEIGAPGF